MKEELLRLIDRTQQIPDLFGLKAFLERHIFSNIKTGKENQGASDTSFLT
jgi:hypothetical protein